MNSLLYIGSFPPPYGGVTVKNALLFEALSQRVDISKLNLMDVKHRNTKAMLAFGKAVMGRKGILVLGISAGWRRRITDFLYYFNRSKMRRSLLFVMGGMIPQNKDDIKRLGCYRRIFVETDSMRKAFEAAGARNVSVYPNCRKRPSVSCQVRKTERGRIRLVYFSLISKEKGAQLVLNAAKLLPSVSFDFYGRIDSSYEHEFTEQVEALSNVYYRNVFDSVAGDVVSELNQYDIHLFPTMCPHEGVPGVIVETKLAAIPTIASNRGYNGELIENDVDGILTRDDSVDELVGAITYLVNDIARLDKMKESALLSAERFYVDRYVDFIVSQLPKEMQVEVKT